METEETKALQALLPPHIAFSISRDNIEISYELLDLVDAIEAEQLKKQQP